MSATKRSAAVSRFYAAGICVDTRLFDGVAELLDQLDLDRLPWGVVTNKAERFTFPLLQSLRLCERAACVVSGDTVARGKPHPDSLLHAAAALQLPPSACLYVGDDLRDVQAARASGMRVLAAKYGYLGDGGSIESWQADGIILHPREVLDYL